jgi:hypothetical protein
LAVWSRTVRSVSCADMLHEGSCRLCRRAASPRLGGANGRIARPLAVAASRVGRRYRIRDATSG